MSARRGARLVLGHVAGVYGVRGWVRVFSETDPIGNILDYSPWFLGDEDAPRVVLEGRRHGKGLIVRLEGCDEREQAAALVGRQISVDRRRLPPPATDEIYWADLEGLAVETREGEALGEVQRLFSTPGNDVLVVAGKRERLIPFLWDQVVKEVDLDKGIIRVDWDPDF